MDEETRSLERNLYNGNLEAGFRLAKARVREKGDVTASYPVINQILVESGGKQFNRVRTDFPDYIQDKIQQYAAQALRGLFGVNIFHFAKLSALNNDYESAMSILKQDTLFNQRPERSVVAGFLAAGRPDFALPMLRTGRLNPASDHERDSDLHKIIDSLVMHRFIKNAQELVDEYGIKNNLLLALHYASIGDCELAEKAIEYSPAKETIKLTNLINEVDVDEDIKTNLGAYMLLQSGYFDEIEVLSRLAKTLHQQGDTDLAQDYLKECLDFMKIKKNNAGLVFIASAYASLGEIDGAMDLFSKFINEVDPGYRGGASYPETEYGQLHKIIEEHYPSNKLERSYSAYRDIQGLLFVQELLNNSYEKEAYVAVKQINDRFIKVKGLTRGAQLLAQKNQYDCAKNWLELAEKIVRSREVTKKQAKINGAISIAIAYDCLEEHDKARELLDLTYQQLSTKPINPRVDHIRLLSDLLVGYAILPDKQKVEEIIQTTAEACAGYSDPSNQARGINRLAIRLGWCGYIERAEREINKAEEMYRPALFSNLASVLVGKFPDFTQGRYRSL